MQRAEGRKKNLLLTLWLLLPFAVLTGIVAIIFLSYGNQKMDARPVGQGAGETGGANALGELIAGNDPLERERIARDLREGRLVDPLEWPHGVTITRSDFEAPGWLVFGWNRSRQVWVRATSTASSGVITPQEINEVFREGSTQAGIFISTGNLTTGTEGQPASETGSIIRVRFPLVPAEETTPGEPIEIVVERPSY